MLVYRILNTKNNLIYIGSTTHYEKRINQHFNKLRSFSHENKFLQEEYNTYGEPAFESAILCDFNKNDCNREYLYRIELEYIEAYWMRSYNLLKNLDIKSSGAWKVKDKKAHIARNNRRYLKSAPFIEVDIMNLRGSEIEQILSYKRHISILKFGITPKRYGFLKLWHDEFITSFI